MPTWGELLNELTELQQEAVQQAQARQAAGEQEPVGEPAPQDLLRDKYLTGLHALTGRAVIVYASSWQIGGAPGNIDSSVALSDMVGFMEACSNIEEDKLDLILHSPGGSAEAAEAIMHYLRTRFTHIRVIVPLAAMSAATMMALAADEIVMGTHSQLGPIDPQFTIATPEGPRTAPGETILQQFELAKKQCADPVNIPAWLPILRSYAPGLLAHCTSAREMGEEFARENLQQYMFAGETNAAAKAQAVAEWFSDFTAFRSHGRRVGADQAAQQGLKIVRLEDDDDLQDAVLSVFHSVSLTMNAAPVVKLIENHHGRRWLQTMNVQPVLVPSP